MSGAAQPRRPGVPALASLARQLAVIDADLAAGRLDRARSYLETLREIPGLSVRHLSNCLAGVDHASAGRMSEADAAFEEVTASALPFPGAQLVAGRHWLARGRVASALGCLGRAALGGRPPPPMLVGAAPESTPPELVRALVGTGKRPNLAFAGLLKRRLCATLEMAEAAGAYAALFQADGLPEIVQAPLASLRDHARHAGEYHEHTAAAPLLLPMSRLVGAPPAAPFAAHGRTLFGAGLDDVIVASRSSLLQTGGHVLHDHQDGELAGLPPDLGCDGQGFALDDAGRMTLVRFGKPALELDEAISLLGPSSRDFGHWIGEFLPRLFLLDALGLAANATLLVDSGMPASHRQALAWFDRLRRPVVELAESTSARVRRLWVASTPSYAPYMPMPDATFDNAWLGGQTAAVAALLAAQRQPAPRPGDPKRLFFPRGPAMRRRLTNQDEVEALCHAQGFTTVRPETLAFDDQLRLVRNATHVVGPAGSALLACFLFGQPGQRVLNLHPPALEETPSLTSIAEERSVEVQVLLGQVERAHHWRPGDSDFSVDLPTVQRVLDEWSDPRSFG